MLCKLNLDMYISEWKDVLCPPQSIQMDILRGLPSAFVQWVLHEFLSIWAQLHFYPQELRVLVPTCRGGWSCWGPCWGTFMGRVVGLNLYQQVYLNGNCTTCSSLAARFPGVWQQKWSFYFCPQTSWSAIAWLAGFAAPYYFRVLLRFNFFLFWLVCLQHCLSSLKLQQSIAVTFCPAVWGASYWAWRLLCPAVRHWVVAGTAGWEQCCELVLKWVVLWPTELPSRQIRVLQAVSVSDVSFPLLPMRSVAEYACCWAWCAGSDACFGLNFVPGSYLALWLHHKSGGSSEKGECEKWGRCPAPGPCAARSAAVQLCLLLWAFSCRTLQANRHRGISISTQRVFSFCHIKNLFYFALGL